MRSRPPWSHRRRRLLLWLAGGAVATGLLALVLPAQYGVSAAFLAGLCAFLFTAALVVFIAVPGPDTLGSLLRTPPLAGSVLVVALLLMLSDAGQALRWLWVIAAAAAAGWTGFAVWDSRRSGD